MYGTYTKNHRPRFRAPIVNTALHGKVIWNVIYFLKNDVRKPHLIQILRPKWHDVNLIHLPMIISLSKTLNNVVLVCFQQMFPTKFDNIFIINYHGERTKIFAKFMFVIFIAFATPKPSTDVLRYSFVTSITPIPHSLKPLHAHILKDIFLRQTNAFKINLSFSFILQHRETGEFRYHYASNDDQLLNSPRLIRNQHDLKNLLDFLASQDFPSHLKNQRPNTKWVNERIVSLRIHLVMTSYPLGNPPNLPDYIKNNRHIIGLEKDENHNYR